MGQKQYELQDHLGNVRAVISDLKRLKTAQENGSDYRAEVISYTNYDPFGAEQPGRSYSSTSYRYGYNGKEKDDEIKGGGNSYDYGARFYDPRVGRFLSIDPLSQKHPDQNPYMYCNNNPVVYVDPDGRDGIVSIRGNTITVSTRIHLYGSGATTATAKTMQTDAMKAWGAQSNGQGWTYKDTKTGKSYNVKFDIKIDLYEGEERNNPLVIPESWDASNRDNFVEVGATLEEVKRSYVLSGDEGQWRGVGRNGLRLIDDDPAPHEVGHILGLKDRYSDDKGPDKGWENNMMAKSKGGKVEQRNINGIVEDAVKSHNEFLSEDGNPKEEFKYEIDVDKPVK